MKGDPIPDTDHITRLCKPMTAPNGEIQATAFMLRDDEPFLSVSWVEYFKLNDIDEAIDNLRGIYVQVFNKLTKNYRIGLLSVDSVKQKVHDESPDNRNVNILHEPNGIDPSHSGIYDLNPDNEFIAELILETILENYPAII